VGVVGRPDGRSEKGESRRVKYKGVITAGAEDLIEEWDSRGNGGGRGTPRYTRSEMHAPDDFENQRVNAQAKRASLKVDLETDQKSRKEDLKNLGENRE